jgi:transaldolase/glucose-6-phosphate isomerase
LTHQEDLILKLGGYQKAVEKRLETWQEEGFEERLRSKDPTLWFEENVPELADRLGWISLPEQSPNNIEDILSFVEEIRSDDFGKIVLMGMGGSSLAPQVFQRTFKDSEGFPKLITIDTPHPRAVRSVEARIEGEKTLFLLASKSGRTLEPLSIFRYFWEKTSDNTRDPGNRFVAITDPGAPLESMAREMGFRRTFFAAPDLGGRYSALTAYGLVPAALIGIDVPRLLDRAREEAERMTGLLLGATLGELALAGRDKVTFTASPSVMDFPIWLEQLMAESTGKDGKGILPVVNEPIINSDLYGGDRFFVLFTLDEDGFAEDAMDMLEEAGHPTARIRLRERYDLGREIFRWEVGVASAGSILGIHPFNQPDVELSKQLARDAMEGDARSAFQVKTTSSEDRDLLRKTLEGWLDSTEDGDYISIQAYLEPGPKTNRSLVKVREVLLTRTHLATTLGYGPQFLHSTGQLHKGGPNTGLFLQIVDEVEENLTIPGQARNFNEVISAQSVGDFIALGQRGRRVVRINLGNKVLDGLSAISVALESR